MGHSASMNHHINRYEGLALISPQGFDANHRDIDLLKLRSFTVGKKIPDSVFTAKDGQEQLVEIMRAMVEFVSLDLLFTFSRMQY